ncbi:hypothetical protein KKG83_07275 [Candidatus Micrarchaeota archaeon]|nr:hypothetical protein [Candidatus Micrarchaeota archaeon]MBU2477243.1 hypothetical protein [Candidatus Micrarchaeota archaeon]
MGKNFLRKIKSLSNAEVIVMVPGQLIHSAQTFRFKTRILKAILKKRNIKIVEEDYTNYKIETESFDRNVEEYFENNFDQFMAKINKVLGEK